MAGPAKFPMQTKFWKSFGRYGIFLGTVVGYDSDNGVYECYYEGDGDEENLPEEEIESWLKRYPSVAKMNQSPAKKKRSREEKPHIEGAAKSNPEMEQSSKRPSKLVAPKKEQKEQEKIWKEGLQRLKAFRNEHGHTCVPYRWPQDPSLGNWVHKQRQTYKEGKLQPQRQALLKKEGFEFSLLERSWNETYQLMVTHKKKFGGFSNITKKGPNKKLYNWIRFQKKRHLEGRLPLDRKKLLDKLGLDFQNQKRTFKENFHFLLEFQKIHGHTNVPARYQDQKLASFVHGKRKQYRTNQIPQHQKEELEKVGFLFRLLEKPRTFEENYDLLLKFKEEFGHVRVPKSYDEVLVRWVINIRSGHTKLNKNQERKLGDIGFEWHLRRNWQESLDALVSYKKKHGHCNVPSKYRKDTALGDWVCRHKNPKQYRALDPEQKDQLKAIGFHPNQEATKPTNSLESNPTAHHGSKSKKSKVATKTTSNQATYLLSKPATRSSRNGKQMARRKIENQADQESSEEESKSDAEPYNSDGSSALEESSTTTLDDSTWLMGNDAASPNSAERETGNQPDQVMSAQRRARATCSELEAALKKPESSRRPARSMGAARRGQQASRVAPDLAHSFAMPTVSRSASPHDRTGSKAAAQSVPDSARSEPNGEPVVPDATESRSTYAPPAVTNSRKRDRRKRLKEEGEPNKKPRWLFD